MDFIGILLVLLQVSSAARRPIRVTGVIGGSVSIECPTPGTSGRKFWCRELENNVCVTVISTTPHIHENYKNRVSITESPRKGPFRITMRSLEEDDAGLYTCGTGNLNDRGSGRTLQVELKVSKGNAPSRMTISSSESLGSDRPPVISLLQSVPAESGNKGADNPAITQPQTINRARTKYTSDAAPAIEFLKDLRVRSAEVTGRAAVSATTGRMTRDVPRNSRTTDSAHPVHTKRFLRSSGKDIFEILIPVVLLILLLVAAMIIVRKQLLRKKGQGASSETYSINLRLSALEQVQGHIPVENIYSVCPRKLQGAERNTGISLQSIIKRMTEPSTIT